MEALWPTTAAVDAGGALWLGGCAAPALAAQHGTPLYVFDEQTLRYNAHAYRDALARHYPGTAQAAYASKAYLCTAIAQIFAEEGLDLDVVSGGELYVALRAGFPSERIHFHGNNKSREELTQALEAGSRRGHCRGNGRGIGRIVVDNFYELATLAKMTSDPRITHHASRTPIWLRLSPGIAAHTHSHIQTGHLDTKFGFAIATGDAERAVAEALAAPGLELVGLHCHIGSQIYEPESLADAAAVLIAFAAEMRARHGFELRELSPGGGWGVPMIEEDPEAPVEPYIAALSAAVVIACQQYALPLPHLVLEPGRSLVARAGVALYRVGARKEIPGVRTYVSVDGGMADNLRPALYGAKYAARVAGGEWRTANGESTDHAARNTQYAPRTTHHEVITLAGKFCESGDVLIRDIDLPRLEPGDLLAVPMAGAYTLSMASNYNLAPRPAVLLVKDGKAQLIQRRETYDDLLARDLPLSTDAVSRTTQYAIRNTYHALRFTKYDAHGNDYIVLNPADWPEPPDPATIRRICDRHHGVGSDGILWGPTLNPQPANPPQFALRLFNPDGSEFEKSGNGLRIFARYLWDCGLPAGPDFDILTPVGPVTAHVLDQVGEHIAMDMGRLSFRSDEIGLPGPGREVIEEEIEVAGQRLRFTAVTIGNPHCVVFVEDRSRGEAFPGAPAAAGRASDKPGFSKKPGLSEGASPLPELAHTLGPELERLPLYPNRTNVQFARVIDAHTLEIAIWERGAGYTLASGSSSCAAAGAAIRTGRCASPVTVRMPGGEMLVEVSEDWNVRLTGTVAFVCRGELAVVRGA